jgi:hypothetical protein
MLAVSSGTIFSGMLFHFLYNAMLIGVPLLESIGYAEESLPLHAFFHPAVTVALALLACGLLVGLGRRIAGECRMTNDEGRND